MRVNTFKAKRTDVQKELQQAGIERTPYSPWGLRIAGKPALNKNEAFLRGDFEVQDEGSQLLAMLVDAKRGEMVVDFCARRAARRWRSVRPCAAPGACTPLTLGAPARFLQAPHGTQWPVQCAPCGYCARAR